MTGTGAYIPYGRHDVDDNDVAAVCEILRSHWLTQGPAVPAFEHAMVERSGARYAVAVNSATSALHIACLALGVGPGDWVWTSPNTFVATANCARFCGANVDFVDIDPDTWCLSPQSLAEKLAWAKATGRPLPKVVIPVHFAGQSCDMASIADLAAEYGFGTIEDASHAVGGRYRSQAVGACRYSNICVFSFHPVKIITSAEGGMALTNDPSLAEKMRLLRTHGITRDPAHMGKSPEGPWYYEQLELGFNYRMNDMQAALGLSQLGKLEDFVHRRNLLAARYDASICRLPLRRQKVPDDVHSARHLYVVRVGSELRDSVFARLRARGLGVNVHYLPVHLQPYYRQMGFVAGQFPEAEAHAREAISLPLYPALSDEQMTQILEIMKHAMPPSAAAASF